MIARILRLFRRYRAVPNLTPMQLWMLSALNTKTVVYEDHGQRLWKYQEGK